MTQQQTSPDTDAQVASLFGVGDQDGDEADQDAQGQEPEQEEEGQEPTVESLSEEIRALRRENASLRVKARQARKATPAPEVDAPDGQPSAQALRAAEERGRSAARMENGLRLAEAELKAALAPLFTAEQITVLTDRIDKSGLVLDDGEVDQTEVLALRDQLADLASRKPAARVGHGRQTSAPRAPSTADQFASTVESFFR